MSGIIDAINAESANSFVAPNKAGMALMGTFYMPHDMSSLNFEAYSGTQQLSGSLNIGYIRFRDEVLCRAVWNLVSINRFKNEYIDMLQEFIPIRSSKKVAERYKAIALKHISDLRNGVDDGIIAHEAKILLDAAKVKMNSGEIGDVLNLDVLSVEFALRKYSKKEAGELDNE